MTDLDKVTILGHSLIPEKVIVHPLVLLSVVDHYNRVAKSTKKRVVGVLLGQNNGRRINVANSFAVPFEEDEKDPSVWFLDHNYVESMEAMFRKVNAKEKMIGWYHSGPKLRGCDLKINELFKKYTSNPVLVIINVKPHEMEIPTEAYFAIEEIQEDGSSASKTFAHIASEIGAEEAEEIGVEHLLRDIKDNAVSTLATKISNIDGSLKGLKSRLQEMKQYLNQVVLGELPVNTPILYNMQTIFSLINNLEIYHQSDSSVSSFYVKLNDQFMNIYLASLVRAVIALHDLINNKVTNRESEKAEFLEESQKETTAQA